LAHAILMKPFTKDVYNVHLCTLKWTVTYYDYCVHRWYYLRLFTYYNRLPVVYCDHYVCLWWCLRVHCRVWRWVLWQRLCDELSMWHERSLCQGHWSLPRPVCCWLQWHQLPDRLWIFISFIFTHCFIASAYMWICETSCSEHHGSRHFEVDILSPCPVTSSPQQARFGFDFGALWINSPIYLLTHGGAVALVRLDELLNVTRCNLTRKLVWKLCWWY